jgi:hypothetical protein
MHREDSNMHTGHVIPRGARCYELLALVGVLALAGCGDSGGTSQTKLGDLGRGSFRYTCVSSDDGICPSGTNERNFDFPTSIAVGGRFKLGFVAKSGDKEQIGNAVLKPASNEFLNDDSLEYFIAKKVGRVAVVAKSSANGKAADLTYVRIAEPKKLKLTDTSTSTVPPPSITIVKGKTLTLRAEAHGEIDEALAGTVDVDWTSSSTDVIELASRPPSARMTFNAKIEGKSTITAKIGSATTTLEVQVVAQ